MSFACAAILLDLDGVLVDSSVVTERHWRSWAAGHGIPFVRIASVHHGRPTVETVRLVAPHLDAAIEAARIETAEAADTDGLTVFAGAAALVRRLAPLQWAVVTSGTLRTATARLAQAGLPTPSVLITPDDVGRGKPAPDPYLLAAARLGIAPSRCVVIEDAPAGVASGKATGARVIAVASTSPPGALADADAVVSRLDDVEAETRDGRIELTWRPRRLTPTWPSERHAR